MTMPGFQKKYLKGLAHGLKPTVFIGQKGVTPAVIQSVDEALDAHELIKVKFVDFKEKAHKVSFCDRIEQTNAAVSGPVFDERSAQLAADAAARAGEEHQHRPPGGLQPMLVVELVEAFDFVFGQVHLRSPRRALWYPSGISGSHPSGSGGGTGFRTWAGAGKRCSGRSGVEMNGKKRGIRLKLVDEEQEGYQALFDFFAAGPKPEPAPEGAPELRPGLVTAVRQDMVAQQQLRRELARLLRLELEQTLRLLEQALPEAKDG